MKPDSRIFKEEKLCLHWRQSTSARRAGDSYLYIHSPSGTFGI